MGAGGALSGLRGAGANEMLRILIANSKGGCGKTMIATNLAAGYARAGHPTVLMDCDPQGSSQHWISQREHRPEHLLVQPLIPGEHHLSHIWTLRIPPRTRVLVVDAPAGIDSGQLGELIRRCDHLLVPVLPSRLDLAVTREFLDRLERLPDLRSGRLRVGLIANRLRMNTLSSRELLSGLGESRHRLVGIVRESQLFVQAAAIGYGLLEFQRPSYRDLLAGLRDVMDWLPPPEPDRPSMGSQQ